MTLCKTLISNAAANPHPNPKGIWVLAPVDKQEGQEEERAMYKAVAWKTGQAVPMDTVLEACQLER